MSLSLTVTPGVLFTASSRITAAMLNAAALPTVIIPPNSITGDLLDEESIVALFGDAFRAQNSLPWGSLDPEKFALIQPVNCPPGLKTENHRGWFVIPEGAAVDCFPSARTGPNSTLEQGRTGLKVFGNSGVTVLRIGTWLLPALAQQLQGGPLTFSCYVWGSGIPAGVTPSLEISTPNVSGDEGAVGLRQSVPGTVAAIDTQWKRVVFALDASTITNWNFGVRLMLRFNVAAGNLDNNGDYVIVADAQIDKGVSVPSNYQATPPRLPEVPAGTIFPFAGVTAPPGWLLCNGADVSRTIHARLFQVIGTAYGSIDGATFKLPDGRGRTFVGAEVAGASTGQLETAVAVLSSAGDTLNVSPGSAAHLRLGMGAYGHASLSGQTIIGLTATTIVLSPGVGPGVSGTVRFSRLGAKPAGGSADAQLLGSAGVGMSGGRGEVRFTKMGCITAVGPLLTVPSLSDLACGMNVSGGSIPPNTTIIGFVDPTTVRLSQSATIGASGITITFWVDAPEGNAWDRYEFLRRNLVMQCDIGTNPDSSLQAIAGANGLLRTGMLVTGHTVIQPNTFVSSLDSGGTNFGISPATSGAAPGLVDLTFSSCSMPRTQTPVPDTLPAFTGNWIIKT